MIPIKEYSDDFKKIYFEVIKKKVDETSREEIISSCKTYMPPDFFANVSVDDAFETLIISSYKKLKQAYDYINSNRNTMRTECFQDIDEKELKPLYKAFYDKYDQFSQSQRDTKKINVMIMEESKLLTCPYCNRDYINSRGKKTAGGQLDHFFSRSKYPIFSLSLYNLVPVCGNCNRSKSNSDKNFISPFDHQFDFDGSITFSYSFDPNGKKMVKIEALNGLDKNIEIMKIKEAYQIHDGDIEELIDKAEIYNKTQCEELQTSFRKLGITDKDIKRAIYGNKIEVGDYGRKPLSKLRQDILKELKILL